MAGTGRTVFTSGLLLALSTGAVMPIGCKPYRIEYRDRPSFYHRAAGEELPDREVLEDGTVVLYRTNDPRSDYQRSREVDEEGKPFRIREEKEDGSIVLRAFLPEHVLANTLTCLQNEEYKLLWRQGLAERTKQAYESRGEGVEEFAAFFRRHRQELARTLNRMILGIPREEVEVVWASDAAVGCRLRRHVADQFVFTQVEMVREGRDLKLRIIQ
ncbi:MAG: hypothetical protein JSV91_15935 [Phycisphaerales bacterium]|nr:MAG: hypothetical protein JSV91_15935 [Phycisphaerales bacterium]